MLSFIDFVYPTGFYAMKLTLIPPWIWSPEAPWWWKESPSRWNAGCWVENRAQLRHRDTKQLQSRRLNEMLIEAFVYLINWFRCLQVKGIARVCIHVNNHELIMNSILHSMILPWVEKASAMKSENSFVWLFSLLPPARPPWKHEWNFCFVN